MCANVVNEMQKPIKHRCGQHSLFYFFLIKSKSSGKTTITSACAIFGPGFLVSTTRRDFCLKEDSPWDSCPAAAAGECRSTSIVALRFKDKSRVVTVSYMKG
jgi:hypothetical protein